MELTNLLNSISSVKVVGEVQRKDVTGIFYDSRSIIKNSIFVAVKGFSTDGHRFILDAINKAVAAVIMEDDNAVPDEIFIHSGVAKIVVKESRKALAEVSHAFYKKPSEKIKLFGVTGTNGKTTTTYFLKTILELNGHKSGLIGTISNFIGDREIKSSLTTPESSDLNNLFLTMIEEGCDSAVMEVSSHSLSLNRVYKLNFCCGVFTNITSDHLDFHNSFEEYLKAKKVLFDSLDEKATAIINCDDEHHKEICTDTKAKILTYGKSETADFKIQNIEFDLSGTRYELIYLNRKYAVSTLLAGEFNAYNSAGAIAAAVSIGIDPLTAVEGVSKTIQVPGRFEVVSGKSKKVIIDYSHTADSLEKALINLRKITSDDQKIYTVFGCGGNRDKLKRPVMGRIASELSDKAIVTNDNPRSENEMQIIKEIVAGISKDNYEVIPDREEAIKTAIEKSEPGSVILIAGKGHEDYQVLGKDKIHFSDKETAEKYLENY
ncbi:MAG TPA: UDP-N-acetylmuramoyl-L-alanyl-D-glutamate--2,6-diaminopimelate ligase [Ignavibacteriaceae bacterium]|nr:UDP-N-acetylmuramoyl-L-alanyl-D-glutamate--2,6-diaminopimelate ligase [Ignavibacteriaceae bacterium]